MVLINNVKQYTRILAYFNIKKKNKYFILYSCLFLLPFVKMVWLYVLMNY